MKKPDPHTRKCIMYVVPPSTHTFAMETWKLAHSEGYPCAMSHLGLISKFFFFLSTWEVNPRVALWKKAPKFLGKHVQG